MALKRFAMGTSVFMGENACEIIPAQAALLRGTRAMLVTDPGVVRAGIVEQVLKHIDPQKLAVAVFDEVRPDPAVKTVDRGASLAREGGCNILIAVGGGSSIDAAKGISVVAPNGGSAADYEGMDKYRERPLPVIAIPTTIGTGSEVTFGAVLTNTDTDYKFILYGHDLAPKVAVLDPLLVKGIPKPVAVPSGMDALTHAMESCISKGATLHSRALALEAIRLIAGNLERAVAEPDDLCALSNMLYAANVAGVAFACSRLGIVHAMALPLGAFFHVPHGTANAILLPHGLEFNLGFDDRGYADMALAMGEDLAGLSPEDAARKAIERVKRISEALGVPRRLADVGVRGDKIADMARDAMKSSHIPANPRPIQQADVVRLYEAAL